MKLFLQGISPELKKNLFVFCNNPYDETVTRANLLDHIQNAKVHLSTTESIIADNTTTKVLAVSKPNSDTNSDIVTAIHDLSLQINNHITQTASKFEEQEESISAISHRSRHQDGVFQPTFNRWTYRGRNNSYRAQNNTHNGYRGRYNQSTWQTNQNKLTDVRCFKCGERNHVARHCLSKEPGNF